MQERPSKLFWMIPTFLSHLLCLQRSEIQAESKLPWQLKPKQGWVAASSSCFSGPHSFTLEAVNLMSKQGKRRHRGKLTLLCLHFISWVFKGWILGQQEGLHDILSDLYSLIFPKISGMGKRGTFTSRLCQEAPDSRTKRLEELATLGPPPGQTGLHIDNCQISPDLYVSPSTCGLPGFQSICGNLCGLRRTQTHLGSRIHNAGTPGWLSS